MTLIKLICGDCREVMETFKENSFDSIVTDPPYELKFMGKKWDGSGISYDEKVWKECLRVLKPGGYLLAFGGSRTYHRLVCKIEDVGFELHPLIGWCYGSGFPKATNLSKQIDKSTKDINGQLTKKWDGWYYGKQSLKPALEPICMAQKPPDGKMVLNVEKWECGVVNIDASRIGTDEELRRSVAGFAAKSEIYQNDDKYKINTFESAPPSGRWPANLILGHAPGCVRRGEKRVRGVQKAAGSPGFGSNRDDNYELGTGAKYGPDETVADWDCVEGCPVKMISEQSGHLKSGARKTTDRTITNIPFNASKLAMGNDASEGTAARFFKQIESDPFFYCAKASKKERGENNSHPTVKPLKLMKYLVRLVTPPGGTVLDPFAGSGTTLLAAKEENFNAVGIELDDEYIKIAIERGCGLEL